VDLDGARTIADRTGPVVLSIVRQSSGNPLEKLKRPAREGRALKLRFRIPDAAGETVGRAIASRGRGCASFSKVANRSVPSNAFGADLHCAFRNGLPATSCWLKNIRMLGYEIR
jgi:hypothetical protein